MKNQNGFIIPLLIIIAVLVIGGGLYFYKMNSATKLPVSSEQNNQNMPVSVQPESQASSPIPTVTTVPPVVKTIVPVVDNQQLKTYTQKDNIFSFKYPSGLVNPNAVVYIDSTNGVILPIPDGQAPDSFQDIKDPKPIYQGATLLTLDDNAGNMIAELTFVMAANEKFTSLIQSAGSKPVSLGAVDGFSLVEYAPLTQQSQGVAVYKLSLGSYKKANGDSVDESMLILAEHVSSSPSLDKNFKAIEQVLQTIIPNTSVISTSILNS
jgi:hypothetical protein